MHAVLRPAERRAGAGLLEGLPDRLIQFGELIVLQERAPQRVETLHERGGSAYLYGTPGRARGDRWARATSTRSSC